LKRTNYLNKTVICVIRLWGVSQYFPYPHILFRRGQTSGIKPSYLLFVCRVVLKNFLMLKSSFEANSVLEKNRRICYSFLMCFWVISLCSDLVLKRIKYLRKIVVSVIRFSYIFQWFSPVICCFEGKKLIE
jgi:hypothetical protein